MAYAPPHETGHDLQALFSNLGWLAALLGSERVVAGRAAAPHDSPMDEVSA